MLKTKCVHSQIDRAEDGLRILAARFRGRGMKKTRYDVWMANLGPSEKLREQVADGKIKWPEFSRRYKAEIFEDQPLDKRNPNIKNHGQKFTLRLLKKLSSRSTVTLMCHCAEDSELCHRHILKSLIERV